MRHIPLPLPLPLLAAVAATLALALAPGRAAGQAFPPPEQASQLHLVDDGPDIGPIVSVGLGWAGAFSLDLAGKDRPSFKDFKAGKALHGLLGVRFGGFGMAAILRRATPGVAASPLACPTVGGCTATSEQNGGLIMFNSAGEPGPVAFSVGLGFWLDRSQIKAPGGELFRRYDAWALVEYVSVEARIGGPTSHFGLGGYGLLAMTNISKKKDNGIPVSTSAADMPAWAEIGLRASFF